MEEQQSTGRNWWKIGGIGCLSILGLGFALIVVIIVIAVAVSGGGDSGAPVGEQDSGGSGGQQQSDQNGSGNSQGGSESGEEAEPVQEPEPIVLTGTGDTVTDPVQVEQGLGVFNMTHQGQGNFAVEETAGAVGDVDSLLANKIGNYSGANAANLTGGELVLDVDADGPWEIAINQPRTNQGSDQRSFSGETDAVSSLIELPSGNVTVDMEHQGDENFTVELLDENGQPAGFDSLVANEIGAYTGSTSVEIPSDSSYVLDVGANGPWTVELS